MGERAWTEGWTGRLAFALVAAIVMAIVGPFGTYADLDPARRTIYWFIAMFGVGIVMQVVILWALEPGRFARVPRPLIAAGASAIAAVPGTIVVFLLETRFRGSTMEDTHVLWLWFFVTIIGFCAACLQFYRLVFGIRDAPDVPTDADTVQPLEAPPPAFLSGLPELEGELISLTMQDHYLSVTTTAGTSLIHMRFADALSELADYRGARIHRSHWIAASALVHLTRRDGKTLAVLTDGRRLPVSRSYLTHARALAVPPI